MEINSTIDHSGMGGADIIDQIVQECIGELPELANEVDEISFYIFNERQMIEGDCNTIVVRGEMGYPDNYTYNRQTAMVTFFEGRKAAIVVVHEKNDFSNINDLKSTMVHEFGHVLCGHRDYSSDRSNPPGFSSISPDCLRLRLAGMIRNAQNDYEVDSFLIGRYPEMVKAHYVNRILEMMSDTRLRGTLSPLSSTAKKIESVNLFIQFKELKCILGQIPEEYHDVNYERASSIIQRKLEILICIFSSTLISVGDINWVDCEDYCDQYHLKQVFLDLCRL